MKNWKDKAVAATEGSRFGAIIACLMEKPIPPPSFIGKATITSDGFVLCSFIDSRGHFHHGAFVGEAADYHRNVEGLANHLGLKGEELAEYKAFMASWIEKDWRH